MFFLINIHFDKKKSPINGSTYGQAPQDRHYQYPARYRGYTITIRRKYFQVSPKSAASADRPLSPTADPEETLDADEGESEKGSGRADVDDDFVHGANDNDGEVDKDDANGVDDNVGDKDDDEAVTDAVDEVEGDGDGQDGVKENAADEGAANFDAAERTDEGKETVKEVGSDGGDNNNSEGDNVSNKAEDNNAPNKADLQPEKVAKVKKPVAKKRTGGGPPKSSEPVVNGDHLKDGGGASIDDDGDTKSEHHSHSKSSGAGPKSSKKKRKLEKSDDESTHGSRKDGHGRPSSSNSPKMKKKKKHRSPTPTTSSAATAESASTASDSEGSCAEFTPSSPARRADDDNIYPDSNMDNIHTYKYKGHSGDDGDDKKAKDKKAKTDFDPNDYCINYGGKDINKVKQKSPSKHKSPPSSPLKVFPRWDGRGGVDEVRND